MRRKSKSLSCPSTVTRRTFLKMLGGTAAGLVVAGCTPQPLATHSAPTVAVSTATPTTRPTVALLPAEDYSPKRIRQQVQAAFDALGGLSDVVRPGASVAIKVNLTGGVGNENIYGIPRPESYWTHPEVVQALGELILDAGAKTLYIVESVYDPASFPEGGFTDVAKALGATLINLNRPDPYADFATASVGNNWFIYQSFPLHRVLQEIDTFVSVPKLKCHYNCGVTASMKNLIGLAPLSRFVVQGDDNYRHAFHNGPDGQQEPKARLPRIVVDLNRARPIHLALIDAVTTIDVGEGPWVPGTTLQHPQVLIASKNALAADAVGAAVMGFDPAADYPTSPFLRGDNYLNLAYEAGLGTNRLSEIDIKGLAIADVRQAFGVSLN